MELFAKTLRDCLSAILLLTLSVSYAEQPEINKWQIAYLMRTRESAKSIDLYKEYRQALGRHDFEVLQQMGMMILEEGSRSVDQERQLLSIFGTGVAGLDTASAMLEEGITSHHAETQMACLQLLAKLQDDRTDELLVKAMSSEFFYTRMQAAQLLALRKHRKAVGHIEALMYRIPPQFRFFFPEFFATIGTPEAVTVLRHLMDDTTLTTRIEAILCAARHGRDDLLSIIRARATHLNGAEEEACAAALGLLKDSISIPKLKKLANSPSSNVQLSACLSLCQLGDSSYKQSVLKHAEEHNLFAINALAEIEGGEDLLAQLTLDKDIQIRLNAAIALLKRRDKRAVEPLYEVLIQDSRDLGFQPQFSLGRSLMAWKIIPSAKQHQKQALFDIQSVTRAVREQILKDCLELDEEHFLSIAERLFESRQTELIPSLVAFLENMQTPNATLLLQKRAQKAGAPLIRTYCSLACFRLKLEGNYETTLHNWIKERKQEEIIRFKPIVPWKLKNVETHFELTPEESSRLLIDIYQTLASCHDAKSIDILLDVIRDGNPKNRYALAGLLIHTIQ